MTAAHTEDMPDTARVTLTHMSDVQPETVQWHWPGRIPVGKLVTLDGDPGLGKSTLALDIAATVTQGGMWPDGTRCEHPGDVLLMSAEDGLADTVRPRLDAAGADVTRVHAIAGVPVPDPDGGPATLRPPTMADIDALEAAIRQTGARLVIVDVLMAYLPLGADSHKDQDIRRVLSRLAELADRTGCTVLLLRHLNKATGRDPLYRGGGSIGIVGAARAGLLVAADPDEPERRVMATVKSNLGPSPESLMYRLIGAGDYGVARVQWEGATAHTARSLLSGPSDDEDGGALTEAEQWLTDYLESQGGAAPSKDVKAEAGKVGIRERTLQRAVKSLALTVDGRGFPRVTFWQLPSPASGANAARSTPATQNLGATGATGDDQRKQVGATGQESQSRQPRETGATGVQTASRDGQRSPMRDKPQGVAPGAPTPRTPGMTDRVQQIVERARRNGHVHNGEPIHDGAIATVQHVLDAHVIDHRPPICPECRRAPSRTDTGICDFCTRKATTQERTGTA